MVALKYIKPYYVYCIVFISLIMSTWLWISNTNQDTKIGRYMEPDFKPLRAKQLSFSTSVLMNEICKHVPRYPSDYLYKSSTVNLNAFPTVNLSNFQSFVENSSPEKRSSSIYMIEHTCRRNIPPRNLCAIESFAYHNRNSSVVALHLMPQLYDYGGVVKEVMSSYSNMHLFTFNLTQLVDGTPLEKDIKGGRWIKNRVWMPQMLSDLQRLVLIWKYGGLYTDGDIICLKNLPFLENKDNILTFVRSKPTNAFFKMRPRQLFLQKIIDDLSRGFNVNQFGSTGPVIFSKTYREVCKETKCKLIDRILGNGMIKHIIWKSAWRAFKYPSTFPNLKFLRGALGVHLSGSNTHSKFCDVNAQSLFTRLASLHCPVTLKALKRAQVKSF